ncbi:MAG TPA: Mov34/MPN/PAD-1 family protein [Xanthobacteraceae bacterium]|jgi:integrative and conjugative element protein (TIGR02256 family)|nr:Mov34/MPN/PAD-1 family protein [Xanthobacteraceae bacterium]
MILRTGLRLVEICETVVETIDRHSRPRANYHEAGGILIGSYRGIHIKVTDCTTPFPGDKRARTLFDRCDHDHQRFAIERWRTSGKVSTFVGEWHTHPEASPKPSSIDRRTWQKVAASNRAGPTFFLIRGYDGWWAGLGGPNRIAEMTELN